MKTLLYANRAEPKSISVISILLLAAVGAITKLRCMHRECYIFASQNLWLLCIYYNYTCIYIYICVYIYIYTDYLYLIKNSTSNVLRVLVSYITYVNTRTNNSIYRSETLYPKCISSVFPSPKYES